MFSKDFLYSIRFRLLASLFILLGLSISISMYGIWSFEQHRYKGLAQREAMQAGHTIEKALRNAMLMNNWEGIQQSIAEIQAIVKPSVISIISDKGEITVSSDDSLVGAEFDRYTEPDCMICHTAAGAPPQRNSIFLETEAGPVLRNVIAIANAPECYKCHSPALKNCGILLYDVMFADSVTMLHTVLLRMAATGLVSFIFLILILSFIIHRYVHRPLHQLMDGFVHVGSGDFNYWVEVDTRGEFQEMADQFNVMSRAIQRSFVEIKAKNWEIAGLYTFAQQLSRAIEWNRLRRIITDLLHETFASRYVVVWLAQEKQEQIVHEVSWRQADDRRYYHREYPLWVEAVELPCGVVPEWDQWQKGELTSPCFSASDTRAFLPLTSKNLSLGLVCLQRPADEPFNSAEKKLLIAVGEQLGIALANARLYRMAITDGLTGLYTRRYCETTIRKFLESPEEERQPNFSVLMLDIDKFKLVNDTHGHLVGDEVLVQLAGLIRTTIRQDDVACRYGGEEFIVLIPGALDVGKASAQRLRRVIEEHLFLCKDAPPLRNTISIGVANFPLHGRNGDEVVRAADQALYQAKEQGRNRVVCFGDEHAPSAPVDT